MSRGAEWAGGRAAEWAGGRAADWRDDALCREIGPADSIFFPEKGGSNAEAKQVCALCPVTGDCLEHALAHDEGWGIWGNTSELERRRMRRARRAAVRNGGDLGDAA